jgi:hypothetical protein
MPGLQDIFNRSAELAGAGNGNANIRLGLNNLNGNYEDDGEDGEDDGMEHLQQPGNTKKRKVPATNPSASPPGHDRDPGDPALSGGEDEDRDGRSIPTGRTSDDGGGAVDVYQPPSGSPFAGLGIRKGRPPPITLAGLQHKEMLKSRKRQLAAVLGALSHGDTLALDQALSANYAFIAGGAAGTLENAPAQRIRISRRFSPRLARAARFSEKFRHPDKRAFLECEFTFAVPCSSEFLPCYYSVNTSSVSVPSGGPADRDKGGGRDAAWEVRGRTREAGREGGQVGGGEQAHGDAPGQV